MTTPASPQNSEADRAAQALWLLDIADAPNAKPWGELREERCDFYLHRAASTLELADRIRAKMKELDA